MAQGKSKWYMIYAVGEVFLVVLGILIALQVNNWNENRKNAKLERSMLENLQAELIVNLEQLDGKIRACRNGVTTDSILILKMGRRDLQKDQVEIDSLVLRLGNLPTFDPADGVMKTMLNSGNINLIRNNELKSSLSSWEGNLNNAKEIESVLEALNNGRMGVYLSDKRPLRNRHQEIFGRSSLSLEVDSILNDIYFENLVVNSYGLFTMLKDRYLILKEEILKMSGLIEGELDRR